jgi:DNA replication protein DnaC
MTSSSRARDQPDARQRSRWRRLHRTATQCRAGTGTGKTHLAIAIARSCIRSGSGGRFYNVVDLVNRLETETRNGRQGRLADHLTRMDFIVLDELGYLPFAQSGGQVDGR